jgi:hypothetical protein
MGHILPFPTAPLAYPARTDALDDSEAVLLLAIRWWVAAIRRDEDPAVRLDLGLGRAGVPDAAPHVEALMRAIAHSARRQIEVNCPHCPSLSADEAQLLEATSLSQAGEREMAVEALALVLRSAPGADFALEPLEAVGALFAAAGRLLRRRRAARPPAAPDAAPNPWPPVAALH